MKLSIHCWWIWSLILVCCTGLKPGLLPSRCMAPLQAERQSVVVSLPFNIKNQRVDAYLAATAGGNISRSAFGQLCESGRVVVNDKIGKKNTKVHNGDRIDYEVEEKPESSVRPEHIPLDILYEDEYLIAVNKPSGMVVHPAPGSPNGTFVNALLYHLGDEAADMLLKNVSATDEIAQSILSETTMKSSLLSNGNDKISKDAYGQINENSDDFMCEYENDVGEILLEDEVPLSLDLPETPEAANASPQSLRPGIVHRLDKGTTGVLIAGKTTEAVAKISALFAARRVRKLYLSVCVGHPGETTIVEPIGRSMKNRQIMTVYDGPPGKPAVTHLRTISFNGKFSTVLARIETGRTHQIRVHLRHRRTPILGDSTYGNSDWNRKYNRETRTWDIVERPLLHSYETEFIHPFTNELMIIRAPIPNDMVDSIKKSQGVGQEEIVNNENNLLAVPTEVKGRNIFQRDGSIKKGYVPSDRLVFEETDWTQVNLLEEPLSSHSTKTRKTEKGKYKGR